MSVRGAKSDSEARLRRETSESEARSSQEQLAGGACARTIMRSWRVRIVLMLLACDVCVGDGYMPFMAQQDGSWTDRLGLRFVAIHDPRPHFFRHIEEHTGVAHQQKRPTHLIFIFTEIQIVF